MYLPFWQTGRAGCIAPAGILFLLTLGVVSFPAGCRQAPAPLTPEPVVLGLGTESLSGLALIAAERDFFTAEGVRATVKKYGSGKLAFKALFDGEVEMATVAETPVVFESFVRRDFRVVACIGSTDNEIKIVARRDRGIERGADLKGKRVATQSASSMHFFLHMFLLKHGLSDSDVDIRFKQPGELAPLLVAGDVEACAMREPLISQVRDELGAVVVVLQEPGLFVKYYTLVAPPALLAERQGLTRRVLRALVRAEAFAQAQPEQARAAVARGLGITERVMAIQWREVDLRVTLHQALLVALKDEARWVVQNKLVDPAPAPNYLRFIQWPALEAVNPEAVTIIH